MPEVKVANVLLESTRQFYTSPQLYVRAEGVVEEGNGCWLLKGPGSFDFTTFFNGLSVAKYDTYTVAQGYKLHLELRGAAATVSQTCVDPFDYYSRPQVARTAKLIASDKWLAVDIFLAYAPSDVIVGFLFQAQGTVELRNAY